MTLSILFTNMVSTYPVFKISLIGFAVILIPSLIFVHLVIVNGNSKKQKHSKAPPVAPAGMIKSIQGMSTNAPFFLKEMVKAAKSDIIRLRLPIPGGVYAVGNPVAMRAILLDKTSDKPNELYSSFDNVTKGESVFTRSNTKEWKSARKCLSYSFNAFEVKRMNQICAEQVHAWIQNTLESYIQKNEAFDPTVEIAKLTFYTIIKAAFEYPVMPDDEEYNNFMHHLELSLKEFAGRQNGNPFRKYYGFLLSEYREAKKASTVINEFAAKILHTYRKNPNKSKNKTIIRMIVENNNYTSDKERLSDILTLVIGGHETTAFTISTTLILLAKHPKVAEKVREELLSMDVSMRSSRSGYLHNVIRESKRMLPVTALGSARLTGRDFSFKDGSIVIPKGATCLLPLLLVHNHEETFKDPENFRPERWENEDDKMRGALMAFSVGNRDCVGQSLAMAEIYSVLPKLLTDYKFEVEKEGELVYFLTLKYAGCRLKATRCRSTKEEKH